MQSQKAAIHGPFLLFLLENCPHESAKSLSDEGARFLCVCSSRRPTNGPVSSPTRIAADTSSACRGFGASRRCRTGSKALVLARRLLSCLATEVSRHRSLNGSEGSVRSASRRTRRFLAMLIWYLFRLNIPVAWGARQQSCFSYRTTRSSHPTKPARCPLSTIQAAWDEVLIARIAQGHQLSSPCRYRRHHVRVYRFGLRLVRDQQVAEDLVTEIFLNLWRQASKV